jgi:putative Mg2+ transporter-C (MgtC) family protein
VRRDSVRSLTTAASIWVIASIGAASGVGLPVLATLHPLLSASLGRKNRRGHSP